LRELLDNVFGKGNYSNSNTGLITKQRKI